MAGIGAKTAAEVGELYLERSPPPSAPYASHSTPRYATKQSLCEDVVSKIEQLKQLYNKGLITESEYNIKKKELLNKL